MKKAKQEAERLLVKYKKDWDKYGIGSSSSNSSIVYDLEGLVKLFAMPVVGLSFTKEELIEFVKYSNKFTDNSTIEQHIEMWNKWKELDNTDLDKPLNINET